MGSCGRVFPNVWCGTAYFSLVNPFRRNFAIRRRSFLRVSPCSQIRTTRQTRARSSRFTRRSRALLPESFAAQNAALFFGWVACLGCRQQTAVAMACVEEMKAAAVLRMVAPKMTPSVSRAWYQASLGDFLTQSDNEILGELTRRSEFAVDELQRGAWLEQLSVLRGAVAQLTGAIFLEFGIPRMGSRVDVMMLIGPVVFVLEFKAGQSDFSWTAVDQVWDYALDLKNFHEASHTAAIVPILIALGAAQSERTELVACEDRVYQPLRIAPMDLRRVIDAAVSTIAGTSLHADAWCAAPYKPTPTIIEAARALYAEHGVKAIRCFDAGRQNLGTTTRRLEEIISDARANRKKVIAFVTGVPGAGKTLVGLNIATLHRRSDEPTHAVLLSGNGPLVAVLRASLTRDERDRMKREGKPRRKGSQPVKQFIQNVHHFRDEAFKHDGPPADHVVVFDEAQRAWNLAKTADFMKRKKGRPEFEYSEPEFLLRYVDRHQDWASVVCLVGGGQEIHTGEAGIAAWLEAVHRSFPHWEMHISAKLSDSEYAAAQAIENVSESGRVWFDDSLHLAVLTGLKFSSHPGC